MFQISYNMKVLHGIFRMIFFTLIIIGKTVDNLTTIEYFCKSKFETYSNKICASKVE